MQFFLNENLNDQYWNHRLQLSGKFLLGDRASFFNMIVQWYVLATCAPLSLANGVVDYSMSAENGRYLVDTVASFSCNSGYYQNGPDSRTSGNWNEQTPTCEGLYYSFCLNTWSKKEKLHLSST